MDVSAIMQFISNLGFPIAVAVACFWYINKQTEQHKAEIDKMAEAVKIVGKKALLEASGNLTPERLRSVALLGVDILSIGALTHSVSAFDISMRMACLFITKAQSMNL